MFLRKLKAYWLLKGRKQRQRQREEQRNLQRELHAKLIGENLYSFHGGLTLHYGKNFTSNQPVYLLQNPEIFLISTVQHKGDKALITVSEQEIVTSGQALTSQLAPNDLAVHSPVHGKVLGILDYLYAAPLQKTCATIVVQALERETTLAWPTDALERLNLERQAWQQEQVKLETGLGSQASDQLITQAVERRAILDIQSAELPERLGLGGVTWDAQGKAQATWARILDFSRGTPIGPATLEPLDCYSAPVEKMLERIKFAGIAGLGGAVFPTERKINKRAFKTLLINAAECEPYITCDDVLMQHYSQELILSWLCMQRVLLCENIVVAIEDDKQAAYQAITDSLKLAISLVEQKMREVRGQRSLDSSLHSFFTEQSAEFFANKEQLNLRKQQQERFLAQILGQQGEHWATLNKEQQSKLLEERLQVLQTIRIRVLPTKYPSGNQRTTIEVLTGYSLSKRQNFTSLGAICLNVATIYSCYRAITHGEVLTQRLVTITGLGIAQPGNYWLPFGVTPAYLAEKLGTTKSFTGTVIIGGPMMGYPLDDLNTPINKATNCIIFVSQEEVANYPRLFAPKQEQACIRCTACQDHCPILLQPQQLYWFSKNKDDKKLVKANLSACIECGLCDYVCPSEIPLVSYFQESKTRIYQTREKERNAIEARVRFERKEARDALEREQREAKRAADKARNQERANSMRAKTIAQTGIDPIAAAKARLAARGVETGRTIVQESGAVAPDNSAIMEQRRQRRLAKQAQDTNNLNSVGNSNGTVPLDRSAVLAAVNRAKSRQAMAQGNAGLSSAEPKLECDMPQNTEQQIARVKERHSELQDSMQGAGVAVGNTNPNPRATSRTIPQNIQEQIARAKAKQAQAQKAATADSLSELLVLEPEQADSGAQVQQRSIPRNIQEQIARAKAKQAQALEAMKSEGVGGDTSVQPKSVQDQVSEDNATVKLTSSSYQMPIAQQQPRRINRRVAQAVARAKAKQAENLELGANSDSGLRQETQPIEQQRPMSSGDNYLSSQVERESPYESQESVAHSTFGNTKQFLEDSDSHDNPRVIPSRAELVANIVARAKAKQVSSQTELATFPSQQDGLDNGAIMRPASLEEVLGLEQEETPQFTSGYVAPHTVPSYAQEPLPSEFSFTEVEAEPDPLDQLLSSNTSQPRSFVADVFDRTYSGATPNGLGGREHTEINPLSPKNRSRSTEFTELFGQDPDSETINPLSPAESGQPPLSGQRQGRITAHAARAKNNHQLSKEKR